VTDLAGAQGAARERDDIVRRDPRRLVDEEERVR
jgi:hypothetical protein